MTIQMIFSDNTYLRHVLGITGFILISLGLTGCMSEAEIARRDEARLRKMFKIPTTAKKVLFENHPKNGGWQREGLRITATFQLSDDAWREYQQQNTLNWNPLPIPNDLILKIGNKTKTSTPDENSNASGEVANEEQQFISKLRDQLPRATSGQFICLTAGNDLLNEATTNCQKYSKRFGDFAIGVIDAETQQLKIRLRTYY